MDELDARGPVFYLSYARSRPPKGTPSDAGTEQYVRKFYQDISVNVAELIATPIGRYAGFMDTSIEVGDKWTSELLWAVGHCSVFVALLSRPYLERQWCAMEWDLFSQRKVVSRSGLERESTAILPVLWTPVGAVPPMVAEISRFSPRRLPEIADAYGLDGVFGLMRTHQSQAYEATVWLLALEIQRIYHEYHVSPSARKDTAGLRRSFNGGPA
ncbi:MAG TPA: TIR-like protein FxsC [Candidatus Limnocylindrales bacterium]|nr:TIR-like protein FxsC [Candidatus Limnocylindrales bacterium]